MSSYIVFLFLFFITGIVGYTFISSKQWKTIREKLQDENILPEEKNKIMESIYDKYKHRTYVKAKEFKLSNKQMTQNISVKQLGYFALTGLVDSIHNFLPTNQKNFARFSNKYISKNLVNGTISIIYKKKLKHESKLNLNLNQNQENKVKSNYKNKLMEWNEPYWSCINNELSPIAKKIFKLKFSKTFKKIRTNSQIAKILNYSDKEVSKIIIESIEFISKKIKFNNMIGFDLFIDKVY